MADPNRVPYAVGGGQPVRYEDVLDSRGVAVSVPTASQPAGAEKAWRRNVSKRKLVQYRQVAERSREVNAPRTTHERLLYARHGEGDAGVTKVALYRRRKERAKRLAQ